MCHCLDVKYHSRCRKQCVRSVVCNALEVQDKTKQNRNVIYFAGVARSAERNTKPNSTALKEVESSPKTQIEILIIKHAQLLRCIAGVRNLVKLIVRWAMHPTRVKAYFCEHFLRKKERATIKLFFCRSRDLFSRTHLMKCSFVSHSESSSSSFKVG